MRHKLQLLVLKLQEFPSFPEASTSPKHVILLITLQTRPYSFIKPHPQMPLPPMLPSQLSCPIYIDNLDPSSSRHRPDPQPCRHTHTGRSLTCSRIATHQPIQFTNLASMFNCAPLMKSDLMEGTDLVHNHPLCKVQHKYCRQGSAEGSLENNFRYNDHTWR